MILCSFNSAPHHIPKIPQKNNKGFCRRVQSSLTTKHFRYFSMQVFTTSLLSTSLHKRHKAEVKFLLKEKKNTKRNKTETDYVACNAWPLNFVCLSCRNLHVSLVGFDSNLALWRRWTEWKGVFMAQKVWQFWSWWNNLQKQRHTEKTKGWKRMKRALSKQGREVNMSSSRRHTVLHTDRVLSEYVRCLSSRSISSFSPSSSWVCMSF